MNIFLILVITFISGGYFLNLIIELLNLKNLKLKVPPEFQDVYDTEKFNQAQQYNRENTVFGIIVSTVETILLILFIVLGGFNLIDKFARSFNFNEIITGIIFIYSIIFLVGLFKLPVSIYSTFHIEQKYGFNRTSVKTFILDNLKSLALIIIIGVPVLSVVLLFFNYTGNFAWLYIWGFISLFQIAMLYIAPNIIMPLFNKFIPLEEGELKYSIENYARNQNFKIKGIFKMDGSKRSSKSNAFFTGIGNSIRIVLFDTLIEKHSTSELLTVLAHEMGHFKLKHIYKQLAISILETGLLLFILSFFLKNPQLFDAFKMDHLSIYGSLVFFGFLYSPISEFLGIASNYISRRFEFQADHYSVKTTQEPQSFINALKKLGADNLSNPNPHPLKVFIEYCHPPILARIRNVKNNYPQV